MKKLFGFLFLICLISPFVGKYAWLKHQIRLVRREVRRRAELGIGREELIEFVFTKKQAKVLLDWERADEFAYEGVMYDVINQEEMGDTVKYWCWADTDETHLHKQVSMLVANLFNKEPHRKQSQLELNRFLTNLYHSAVPRWCSFLFSTDINHLATTQLSYTSISPSPFAPPPEVA